MQNFQQRGMKRSTRQSLGHALNLDQEDGQERKVEAPEDMSQAGTGFFKDLFTDASGEILPGWINKQRAAGALEHLKRIDGILIREALAACKKGKTCSSDLLVIEMFVDLDDDIMDASARSFRERLLSTWLGREDPAWDQHLVNLLKKRKI